MVESVCHWTFLSLHLLHEVAALLTDGQLQSLLPLAKVSERAHSKAPLFLPSLPITEEQTPWGQSNTVL